MEGIQYPVSLDNIRKFEKQNPKYGINVFVLEKEGHHQEIVPRIICKDKNKNLINLLLITNENKAHYVWIKSFSRLMRSNVTKHNGKNYWCYNCLCHFSQEKMLNEHQANGCFDNPCAKIVLPTAEKAYIEYTETMMKKQLKVPFIIYADFESLTQVVNDKEKYQAHNACSFAYKIV